MISAYCGIQYRKMNIQQFVAELKTSVNQIVSFFSSQGPPGVPGLKGESGEAGPQVQDISILSFVS